MRPSCSSSVRYGGCFLGLWLLLLSGVTGRGQGAAPGEYEVKAAMLCNLVKFVEWPARRFAGPQAPLIIGVLGKDPFGPTLDQAVAGQKVGERPLEIRRLRDERDVEQCHLLFLGRWDEARLGELLPRLERQAVLTVNEHDRFTRAGGLLSFFLQENRVRFEVNLAAVERAGLRIHPQVLKLARLSRDGREARN